MTKGADIIAAIIVLALAIAILTPKIELAPSRLLFFVPSKSQITESMAFCSVDSRPDKVSNISLPFLFHVYTK